MHLRKLTAVTFRNYATLEFTPHPVCTVLCGQNGQGKTNVVEAIGLLATARSHRGARDRELTKWDGDGYRLDGLFGEAERDMRTVLVFDGAGKRVECDGVVQERLSAVLGRTPVSIFSPEDLGLVKRGPAERRRFLDMNLSQVSGAYLADLQTYVRALKQRNRALQMWAAGRSGREAVEVWDGPLVDAGCRVQAARAAYVQELAANASAVYGKVAGGRESLEVTYTPSIEPHESVEDIADAFQQGLRVLADRERRTGSTPCGPHRDDLALLLDARSIRDYGSQGQQRSVVLALKLAEGAVLMRRSATPPITLLDDFASELDETRQRAILETIQPRGQVVITTTELTTPLRELAKKLVLRVDGGLLHEAAA